jgi:hypothetical protein
MQRYRFALAFLTAALLLDRAAVAKKPPEDGGVPGNVDKALVLRVNPATGAPGGVVDVVLRTYAPRPIRQGQVLIKVVAKPAPAKRGLLTRKSLTQPVRPLTLESVTVFSVSNDAAAKAALNSLADGQAAQVSFQSSTGSINAADGPMIVLRCRLDPSAAPGDAFDLSLDPAQTRLTDSSGRAITVSPQSAVLTVRAATDPFLVQAGDSKVLAGGVAELGVSTFEPFPVGGGRFTLTWDPRLASGPPTVRLDPRYGQAVYTADASQPGRLVVDFQSPDASFNRVPGSIVSISLPVDPGAMTGDVSPFALDPAGSWLVDGQGNRIPVTLADGSIVIQ